MLEQFFAHMFVNGVWFVGGLVVSTVVWFFVLRNNKKRFNEWMSGTEQYLYDALMKMDEIGEDATAKIDELFAKFKEIKK
jgi:hypothetical protein